ncbi:MAG: helix-turn-helix domain-containing protein [Bdellovibrionales bacterium]|nr:helix-turn-helix domain-containing protein [Bdellovibrionales bacterium]
MRSNKDKKHSILLNCGDALELSKFKKRTKLKKAGKPSRPSGLLFDNLISVEELAVIFGLAPQTIRNWIALGKIPHVKLGRKHFFQERSVQRWLNRKEEPSWE